MRRHHILFSIAGIILLSVSRPAAATETTATLELVNAANVLPSIPDNGVYAGPYTAGVVSTGGSVGATFPIICDNFDRDVSVGLTWTAVSFQLTDPNALNPAASTHLKLLGDSTAAGLLPSSWTVAQVNLQSYEAAAWLAQQIMSDYNSPTRNDSLIADLNWAIWAIFSTTADSPTGPSFGGFDSQAQSYYALALTQTYNVNQFSDVTFWTPSPNSASQEYITVSPEPASMLLFGTGLLAFAALLRRKRSA